MGKNSIGILAPPSEDSLAAALRGFGPVGIIAIIFIFAGNLAIIPLSALLVIAWAWRSRTPWREIGYVKPVKWLRSIAAGILFGVALKLLMKIIIMPLFGADPVNHAYQYLVGNRAVIPITLYSMIIGAGFGEETVFRGFLFERLRKFLGNSAGSKMLTVLLTSLFFGIGHYFNQGRDGVIQATIVGLIFGSVYAQTGRIWMLMFAHAAFDLTAYAIIYWGMETRFAHLVFY